MEEERKRRRDLHNIASSVLFCAPLHSPNSHNSGSFLFAFLHGEIALISVAYLSGSCKLLPCLLETVPQHHLPGPVSHLLTFFLALNAEAEA